MPTKNAAHTRNTVNSKQSSGKHAWNWISANHHPLKYTGITNRGHIYKISYDLSFKIIRAYRKIDLRWWLTTCWNFYREYRTVNLRKLSDDLIRFCEWNVLYAGRLFHTRRNQFQQLLTDGHRMKQMLLHCIGCRCTLKRDVGHYLVVCQLRWATVINDQWSMISYSDQCDHVSAFAFILDTWLPVFFSFYSCCSVYLTFSIIAMPLL